MRDKWIMASFAGICAILAGVLLLDARKVEAVRPSVLVRPEVSVRSLSSELDILVNGRPLAEYYAKGRTYIEAVQGAEYQVQIRNPFPYRVAVALSVDGLNSIDARRTSAWNASKWVIEPYQTLQVDGWQMSSSRARRFYFTTEGDSYAAKLGQASNLGLISAVFFRERASVSRPITAPPQPGASRDNDSARDRSDAPSLRAETQGREKAAEPAANEEYAATGIGRSVTNEVQWISMQLEPRPIREITLRYEYYQALVKLGILPRSSREDFLRRREAASGFEDRRYSPEP